MNIDGRDYVVEGYRDAQTLLLRDIASGKLTVFNMEEILEKVKTPSVDKLGNPVEEELLEIAMQRYEVIKDLVHRRVTRQEGLSTRRESITATLQRYTDGSGCTGKLETYTPLYRITNAVGTEEERFPRRS